VILVGNHCDWEYDREVSMEGADFRHGMNVMLTSECRGS